MSYYDQIADGYNELYGEEQKRKAKFILGDFDFNSLKSSDPYCKKPIVIVDLGCGSGLSSEFLLNHLNHFGFKKIKLIMIDPSKGLLDKIKINPENYSFELELEAIQGSAEQLTELVYTKVHFLFSLTALQNCLDLDKAIHELNIVNSPFIISLLYRGIEDKLSEIKGKFSTLKITDSYKDNKDIYFVKQ